MNVQMADRRHMQDNRIIFIKWHMTCRISYIWTELLSISWPAITTAGLFRSIFYVVTT